MHLCWSVRMSDQMTATEAVAAAAVPDFAVARPGLIGRELSQVQSREVEGQTARPPCPARLAVGGREEPCGNLPAPEGVCCVWVGLFSTGFCMDFCVWSESVF